MCEDAGVGDDWYVSSPDQLSGCHSRMFIAKETAGTIGITNHQLLENGTKLEVLCFSVVFGQRESTKKKNLVFLFPWGKCSLVYLESYHAQGSTHHAFISSYTPAIRTPRLSPLAHFGGQFFSYSDHCKLSARLGLTLC